MATMRMTAAELARDLPAVLQQVRQGVEVIVEQEDQPSVIMKAAVEEQTPSERADAATLDPDFAEDVREIVRQRRPWQPVTWD